MIILDYSSSLCSRRVKILDLKLDSGPYGKLNGVPVLGYNSTNSSSYDYEYLLLFFKPNTTTMSFSLIFRIVWLVSPVKATVKLDYDFLKTNIIQI